MNILRIFRYSIRIAAWATPHVQRWMRNYNVNATEAERHFQARNYSEAEKYYTAALEDAARRHSPAERRVRILLQIAESRRRQRNLEGALASVNEGIQRAEALGATHPVQGMCLDALARIQMERGHIEEALAAGRAALQLARVDKHGGPALIAERCHNLAAIEKRSGNTKQHLELLRESLDYFERAHGSRHVDTANQLSKMGVALQNEGSYEEALPLLEKASRIHGELLGADAPELMDDLEHLAEICHAQGKLPESAGIYDRLLRLKERQVGADPLAYGRTLTNASEVYMATNQYARAHEYLHHAARLLERNPGYLAPVLEKFARLYEKLGRDDEAQQMRARLAKSW